jgi:uncharacterized protein (DUF1697 family)
MTTYVALLRGVNVGGVKVDMRELKRQFEELGCADVATYINSGNVIFRDRRAASTLTRVLERELGHRVALRTLAQMEALVERIPDGWRNDKEHKTDVAFLLDEADERVWHVAREDVRPGEQMKLDAAATVRNVNTVRKLTELMRSR